RKGRAGVAVTLVDWDELARWTLIDKALGLGCPEPAETYSSSPHLYAELDIPTDAGGSVGPAKAAGPAKRAARDGAERAARAGAERAARGGAERPARTRSRRRTRGGKSVTGHVEPAEAEQPEAKAGHTARRRRRRPRKAAAASA